mmetsp:Transcript_2301/g.3331  ORF Transcript_2301/g.3331 Transcript_2301/m.3331 type:complete len:213 (-) Transcript_2301:721-1359(-)
MCTSRKFDECFGEQCEFIFTPLFLIFFFFLFFFQQTLFFSTFFIFCELGIDLFKRLLCFVSSRSNFANHLIKLLYVEFEADAFQLFRINTLAVFRACFTQLSTLGIECSRLALTLCFFGSFCIAFLLFNTLCTFFFGLGLFSGLLFTFGECFLSFALFFSPCCTQFLLTSFDTWIITISIFHQSNDTCTFLFLLFLLLALVFTLHPTPFISI